MFLNDAIVICSLVENGWRVAVINNSSVQVDIYFKSEKNRIYESETIVTVNSFKTLREAFTDITELPIIPKGVNIFKFEVDDDDNISICSSRTFFANLLEG